MKTLLARPNDQYLIGLVSEHLILLECYRKNVSEVCDQQYIFSKGHSDHTLVLRVNLGKDNYTMLQLANHYNGWRCKV